MILYPDLSATALETSLSRLLNHGDVTNNSFMSCCRRLDQCFRSFITTCPTPEWAPGLRVTQEIRLQTELYLPMAEIRRGFLTLFRLSCRYKPLLSSSRMQSEQSWPDFLEKLQPFQAEFNPGNLLYRLATDYAFRLDFLAAFFLPDRFGCCFNRYPTQSTYLSAWLATNHSRLASGVSLLDAACGTGEGSYDAAEILLEAGYSPEICSVVGTTVEPLELVAAAHGWFPNNEYRARVFKDKVTRLLALGADRMIQFYPDDIRSYDEEGGYDVLLCNGLLGGPLLHDRTTLEHTMISLARRLRPGGLFLAEDRFHNGWEHSKIKLASLCRDQGLMPVKISQGIAAVKI